MENIDKVLLKEVNRFVTFLSNLTEEEKQKLAKRSATVRFTIEGVSSSSIKQMERGETENIINRLKSYNTREEGESYLLSLDLKRKDLEAVAKALDLPYSKKDTIVKIRERLLRGLSAIGLVRMQYYQTHYFDYGQTTFIPRNDGLKDCIVSFPIGKDTMQTICWTICSVS